jgi:hypothetical protein
VCTTRGGRLSTPLLAIAALASLWPAALVVEAATAGGVSPPLGAAPARVGLIALEADQHALATEAEFGVGDTPVPDLAARAARLRAQAGAWDRRGDGAHAAAIAAAMRGLDDAIVALARDASPGARVAFERSLAAYDDAIAARRLI